MGGFRFRALEKVYNGLSSTFHLTTKGDFRGKFGIEQDPVRTFDQRLCTTLLIAVDVTNRFSYVTPRDRWECAVLRPSWLLSRNRSRQLPTRAGLEPFFLLPLDISRSPSLLDPNSPKSRLHIPPRRYTFQTQITRCTSLAVIFSHLYTPAHDTEAIGAALITDAIGELISSLNDVVITLNIL